MRAVRFSALTVTVALAGGLSLQAQAPGDATRGKTIVESKGNCLSCQDARNGSLLWKIPLGGQINSDPMSYSVNGRQYIAVNAGTSLFTFALRQ